jgi:glycosyl transferase family 25
MGKETELGIDHVYVVHAPTGYEQQEQYLRKVLGEKMGFEYHFLGRDNGEMIATYFVSEIGSILNRATIFCTLNHIMFYEAMVKNNDRVALILEDDPYFSKEFLSILPKIVAEAKTLPQGFFISLENSTLRFPSRKAIRKGQYLYKAEYGRCAGAYLMDKTAAQNVILRLGHTKCNTVIDHWHNDLVKEGIFTMYWAHPACVEQGSLTGRITGGNSTRKVGILRRISWVVQKAYKQYFLRMFR